jgi:Replication initiator protein A/DnaA N-terminal domain
MTSTRKKTKSSTIKPTPATPTKQVTVMDRMGTDLLPKEEIRSEVNFLTLPFFKLSRHDKRLRTEYYAIETRGDTKLEVYWKVAAHQDYGYPGVFDRKVHKAIEQIIGNLLHPIQNPIRLGSLLNLAKLIGMPLSSKGTLSGKSYKEIQDSLTRMVATTIHSEGAFYDKSKERGIKDVFHLYDRVVWIGQKLPSGEIADTNYLFLGSWYLDNINNRYVKPLDYTYYRSLKDGIASRLYELLGVKFKGNLFINYSYSKLCQLLPVPRYQYFAQAKRQLEQAHQELTRTGFFDNVEWVKVNDPHDWLINYYAGTRAKEEIQRWSRQGVLPPPDDLQLEQPTPTSTPQQVDDDINDLVVALQNFGISKKTAKRLAKNHSEQDVFDKLELVQWLIDTKSPLVSKNPQGFLVRALDEGYLPKPPKGYKTATQRKEEAKRQEQEVAQQRQATEQFQKAREEARQRLLEKHPPQSIEGTDHTTESAWGKVLASLQEQVSPAVFNGWLKDTLLLQVTDTAARIAAPSRLACTQLERRMYREISNAMKGVLGKDLDLEFVVANPE